MDVKVGDWVRWRSGVGDQFKISIVFQVLDTYVINENGTPIDFNLILEVRQEDQP